MTSLVLNEKVFTSRAASTANLLISSADRDASQYVSPFRFQVSSQNSLMNGFFTRIAVAEVNLSWSEPNILTGVNDTFSITDLSGTFVATLPQGFYTFKQAIDQLVILLNATASTLVFSVSGTGPTFSLNAGSNFTINETRLCNQMGFFFGTPDNSHFIDGSPVLLNQLYIDFVCTNLTNQQKLKDSSTACNIIPSLVGGNTFVRDVLCRWYFASDSGPPPLDAYGFPILMGYTGFYLRRAFAYPKQIRWEANIPVGNLLFEVYDDKGDQLTVTFGSIYNTDWYMTLLVSED